jgi:hypothetical protein
LRRSIYLILSIIALFTVSFTLTTVPVKASPYVNFFIAPAGTLTKDIVSAVRLDVGEFIYRDLNVPAQNYVSAGDRRMCPVTFRGTTYANNSLVVAGDTDAGLTLLTGWGSIKHVDNLKADSTYEFGEWIYKDVDASGTVTAGDVRYYPVPGYKLGSTVAAGDTDVGKALVTFYPTTSTKYEKWADVILANSAYDFPKVFADVMVDCDIVDNTTGGMVGWGFSVRVDPTVLTPFDIQGGVGGYFLDDFVSRDYSWNTNMSTSLLKGLISNGMDPTEQVLPTPTTGCGNQSLGSPYPERLCTLVFSPISNTTYSPITLIQDPSGNYMTPDGKWHLVNMISSSYLTPPVPEFPLGIAPVLMLAPAIPIVYLWRTRKKRMVN